MDISKIKFGVIPSPPDKRDYPLEKLIPKLKRFPDEYFEEYKYPVKNQEHYSACVNHTISVCCEEFEEEHTGEYKEMSCFYLYGLRKPTDYQDEGMIPRQALMNWLENGNALISDFPNRAEVPTIIEQAHKAKEKIASKTYPYRISAFAHLYNLEDYKTAFMQKCKVLLSIPIYASISQVSKDGKVPMPKEGENPIGYHMVKGSGWNSLDEVIFLNSWSDKWGLNGYGILPKNYPIIEIWMATDNIYPLKDYRITRIAGKDRFETAVNISIRTQDTAENIVLCNAYSFADALAGSAFNYPILLTDKDTLNPKTREEIKRLNVKNIYILGGIGVVSQEIEEELKKDYNVIRIFGADRHKTAIAVGDYIMSQKPVNTVILATGQNFPDALSIAPWSAKFGYPIIFAKEGADGYNLDKEIQDVLEKWNIKNIIISGGYGVVSDFIEIINLKDKYNTIRMAGSDRYQTSLAIAEYFNTFGKFDSVVIATGQDFPDALAGSVMASKFNAPILLVSKDDVDQDIRGFVARLGIKDVFVLGGDGVVSQIIINKLIENK